MPVDIYVGARRYEDLTAEEKCKLAQSLRQSQVPVLLDLARRAEQQQPAPAGSRQ